MWRSEGIIGQITTCKQNTKRPRGPPRQRWADRRSEDIRSEERRRNCKRQGGMEAVCCCGNGPAERPIKCQKRRRRRSVFLENRE